VLCGQRKWGVRKRSEYIDLMQWGAHNYFFLYTLRKYPFTKITENDFREKDDFTILNYCVLRKNNDFIIKRRNVKCLLVIITGFLFFNWKVMNGGFGTCYTEYARV